MEKEVVIFGSYHDEPLEWYILDKIDNKFLLVTKNIIDNIEFNNKLSSTTWEKSLIRQWLNNDFLNNTFTTEEYGHIQTTRVKTIDGVYNNVNGGNATDDKIFLLSVEEIEKYFPLLDSRICGVTDYAKNKLGHDNSWWWLRSMVNAQYTPAYINKDGKVASMSARNSYIGTRPAMWIDLSKTKDEYVKSQIEYLK